MADDPTLLGLIDRFRRFGAATAVIGGGEGGAFTAVSFEQLSSAAFAVAHDLAKRGVGKDARVAISGPNSPGWVAFFWGIIAAGAVAVPLDPRLDDASLVRAIERAECRLAFLTFSRLDAVRRMLPGCDTSPLDTGLRAEESHAAERPVVAGENVAVIVFTSGTTGTPKAVPLSHRNLLSNVEALLAEGIVAPGDRAMVPLPLHHIYPLTVGMMTPLAAGSAIVLAEAVSGPQMMATLKSSAVTVLVGVPRLYRALAAGVAARLPQPAVAALSVSAWLRRRLGMNLGPILFRGVRARIGPRLRLLVCGGAALDPEVEERLLDLGWEVLTGYGLSETSPILTFNRREAARVGSAGQPLPGTAVRISGPDADGVGEIEARGPGVFAGYWGYDAATRAAFTPDGWFRTGDLGRLDDRGYLQLVARRSETIVLSTGKKVYPEDVETAYADVDPIKELAVLSHDGALVALVVADFEALRARGAIRLVDAIRDALANRAATLPSHFRLSGFAVAREPLPRTQIGKIRRHLLPDLFARAREARAPAQPPVLDDTDRALLAHPVAAALWNWLQSRYRGTPISLGTSPQLDLGVDSLGWIDVTLAMQHALGIELGDDAIARVVTLRDLLREAVSAQSEVSTVEADITVPSPPAEGRPVPVLHRLLHVLIRCLMRLAYRVRAEGVDRLPPDPIILCPNHVSFLDPFAVAAVLPYGRVRTLRWGGWSGQMFRTPMRRAFSRIAGVLPVDPDRTAMSSLARATDTLSSGRSLVWFAEGERSRDGRLMGFRPGIGALVQRTRAAVVPVYIEGAFAAWPRGRRRPRLGRIVVRFGDPLPAHALLEAARSADAHGHVATLVREAVAKLARGEPTVPTT